MRRAGAVKVRSPPWCGTHGTLSPPTVVVFGCVAARAALLSEARFTLQSTVDMHLFGTQALSILEYPWPG